MKAIRDASPQARHHFTQADQVNQLVSASEADPDLGFMARLMALCSLPRTNPGNRQRYVRTQRPVHARDDRRDQQQAPLRQSPRCCWPGCATEAVRTQKPRAGSRFASLSEFMRTLGIYSDSGGRGGVQTRLRNQMNRLFQRKCPTDL